MKPAMGGSKKPDFLDEVVDEMGDEDGGTKYGADMESEDGEGDDQDAQEDRILAAKQVAKAMGLGNVDFDRLADALSAFVKTC